MTPSARFAETDFPAEVEDLITALPQSAVPSCAAAAGYAVLATESSAHALLFAIAAGSGLDATPIPLQPSSSPHAPSLAAWLAAHDGATVRAVAVAALTRDGTLRVYPSIDVRSPLPARPRCAQLRVSSALAASVNADAVLPALHVARDKDGNLFVFGGRGSAARVFETSSSLEIEPLRRSRDEGAVGSLSFGSVFYSAIRSIGQGVTGRDAEWEAGAGPHEIVGCAATTSSPGVVLARKGGVVEKWGPDGLNWTFCVFDYVGGRGAGRTIVSAHVTSDDTAVVLVKSAVQSDPGHRIVTFDVQSKDNVPKRIELDIPLQDGEEGLESQCLMVVSGDIVYFYAEAIKQLAWLSVARGVSADGQVQGNTLVGSEMKVMSVVDAAFGLEDSGVPGGVAAFIHPAGVWLASSAVPPPMSLDKESGVDDLTTSRSSSSILWRAFLQYCADQKGATRASLQGLVSFLVAEGADVSDVLSSIVEQVSLRIISSVQDSEKAPVALLIDTELEKKHGLHTVFLKLLADPEVFSELRLDAPSVTEDRIWNAIKLSSRYSVLTDGEKLAAARRVRDLENRQSTSGYYQRFNDAASASLIGSEKIRTDVARGPYAKRGTVEDGGVDIERPSVLTSALKLGGTDIVGSKVDKRHEDSANELYLKPQEFHRFLPALERSMSDSLAELQSMQTVSEDNGAGDVAALRREAQNIVLLSCEAAIDVVQGSREARELAVEMFSSVPNGMGGIGNWMSDLKTCGNVLMKISQRALDIGAKSRQAEGRQVMHAATLVVDELLSRTPFDDTVRNARRVGRLARNPQAAPRKRRRLDLFFEGTDRGKELRHALNMLRQSNLEEDAFRLAEKYGDYGTMLALRVGSAEFDQFMETSLRKFGDEFGLFAFNWLEERGEIRLLLRGRESEAGNSNAVVSGRSSRMKALLSEYFRGERRHLSNLAWVHWITQENVVAAADTLIRQVRSIAIPGKPGSAINTPILSSIAKLALHADVAQGEAQSAETNKNDYNYLTGQLNLSKVQARLDPNADAFLQTEDLVRQFMEMTSGDSEALAEQVVMAIEALRFSAMEVPKMQALEDSVWRRCVERQSDLWLPIIGTMTTATDIEMRKKLKETALYIAASRLSLSERIITEVIGRGTFESSEFMKHGCTREVSSLVKAAVSLAAA